MIIFGNKITDPQPYINKIGDQKIKLGFSIDITSENYIDDKIYCLVEDNYQSLDSLLDKYHSHKLLWNFIIKINCHHSIVKIINVFISKNNIKKLLISSSDLSVIRKIIRSHGDYVSVCYIYQWTDNYLDNNINELSKAYPLFKIKHYFVDNRIFVLNNSKLMTWFDKQRYVTIGIDKIDSGIGINSSALGGILSDNPNIRVINTYDLDATLDIYLLKII